MKHTTRNKTAIAIVCAILVFNLSACYESHYYHHYHHHTREWYDRRHEAPPAGVDFNVDVHNW
ncbi:hypothetical protein [Ferruginibacter albus]|uniref:hypothetical protein n=1 Tax=Ferruginibacter albus TaxID=2875540 RepID=UPI001CC480D3|nr:hypothetical protein [Ferruginibacter albus]UAY53273.1 hypothetical protein K9M53_06270 [Ferruginibacter albus]